jgi:signal transduction histidine kinase
MRHKIVVKLALSFTLFLLIFSVIMGVIFTTLFQSHTINMRKQELSERAQQIAATLSAVAAEEEAQKSTGGHHKEEHLHQNDAAYLKYLIENSIRNVWVVDEGMNLIMNEKEHGVTYADLPEDAEKVVEKAFEGKMTYSRGFSNLLRVPTLTVAAPIKGENEVVGAVLVHSPVEGINRAMWQGYKILGVSIFITLAICIGLSFLFSFIFAKPLKKMQQTALQLAQGDFSAKTGVKQKDEIGALAGTIDMLSGKLLEASEEIEQFNRAREEFVSNVAHELRTPVTVLRGSLEALCDGVITKPEQVEEYHQQMLKECIYLQRLVNDMLELNRLRNADFQIQMECVDIADVVRDVVRSARQIAQKKNIHIEMDVTPWRTTGDYGRLRQMFLIVLDNAVKFSPEGAEVSIFMRENRLSVSDHGCGMDKETLEHIFDRFYTSRSEINKGGTGLGLAIANQIAVRHAITLTVESTLGEGSCFTFEFPPQKKANEGKQMAE